jgi:MFS family permease
MGKSTILRTMRLAGVNAFLWAVGNGLVSTQLVVYFANEFGAKGLAVSFILAAPRFAGVLRLGVPAVMARIQHRKAVCLAGFMASALVLCALPSVALVQRHLTQLQALTLLVASWCIYHLLEYAAVVALWSWLGDLTPSRIRGRLLGGRERWLVLGRIGGIGASALLTIIWGHRLPIAPRWQPLALSAAAGALMMGLALVPLAVMPSAESTRSAVPRLPWRSLVLAVTDPAYRRLLAFSVCFALASGITLSAQQLYPIRVLAIPYSSLFGLSSIALSTLMWSGQSLIAPHVGRLADRFGNRRLMAVSLMIASSGLLFFWGATPERAGLIVGSYLAWIAYAGLNVGLDNMKLKLAPADNNAPYLAAYHAVGDLANGVAILLGGLLYDRLAQGGSDVLALYAKLFLCGWLARTATVFLIARLIEPNAQHP